MDYQDWGVTLKHILADICCLKMFLLHLQDLKTWGCYGWIVTLQEFLEVKVDEMIDPLNAILLNFDNKVRRSWYILIDSSGHKFPVWVYWKRLVG